MSIPDFEKRENYPYRLLPEGIHLCDEEEFRARFVDQFPNASNRKILCDGFFRLRQEAVAMGAVGFQWVNGSFVVDIDTSEYPKEIDVVTFYDHEWYNGLTEDQKKQVENLLGQDEQMKLQYYCDTYFVAYYPPKHKDRSLYLYVIDYWINTWSSVKSYNLNKILDGITKGFVEMSLGDYRKFPVMNEPLEKR